MSKLIQDGKVAVVYSPGFGAGWSTWAPSDAKEFMCTNAEIAAAVLAGDIELAKKIAIEKSGHDYVCTLADALKIQWVKVGSQFDIREHDGYETVEVYGPSSFMIA